MDPNDDFLSSLAAGDDPNGDQALENNLPLNQSSAATDGDTFNLTSGSGGIGDLLGGGDSDLASIFGDTNIGTSPSTAMLPIPVGGAGRNVVGAIVKAVSARLGQHVTAAQIVRLIRTFGAAAAQALGLNSTQTMALVVKKGRRRSRGITARQLRNAARVARTLSSMQQNFRRAAGLGGSGHHHRRAAARRGRK